MLKHVTMKRLLIVGFAFFTIITGICFFLLEREWVDLSMLELYSSTSASVILDDEGVEFARFECDRRTPIPFEKIPTILVQAFVAAEDHNFFTHPGISIKSIIRSFLINLYHHRIVQGASTITQQLARLMYLTYERTFYRKFQELFLALQLEQQLSKQQIFELYINNIYFGRGIYGVEAACKRFWNKQLSDITVEEAATIAAVANSARIYSPLNSTENSRRRRNMILKSMLNLEFINQDQFDKSSKTKVKIVDYMPGSPIKLYIQEWVRAWAENKFGKEVLYKTHLKIKTTINPEMQNTAEQAYAPVIYGLQQQHGNKLNGGVISIEASTGKIKVLIGGMDFKKSQFNRALQAKRQMGSSFKPILYAFAISKGYQLDATFVDEPIEMIMPNGQTWTPKNWDSKFDGLMTLARALTYSNNIVTIKLYLEIYKHYDWMEWAHKFGISANIPNYPSSALGTTEVTPEENCAAFNVFANNGVYVKPYLIEWVKNDQGEKIWENEHESHKVLDSKTNSVMISALGQRMILNKNYLGKNNWLQADSIGKSGSTNGAASTWFVGATPELTTAVYIGRDDNKPMGEGVFASRTAFPIWLEINKKIKCDKKHFHLDPTLTETNINWRTGEYSVERPYIDPDIIKILKH
ncbi:MAG: PBP1A family penicillin-binding protein [bacterium]